MVAHFSEPLVCKRFFYVIIIIFLWMSTNRNSSELGSWDLDLNFLYFKLMKYFEVNHGHLDLPLISTSVCISKSILLYNKNNIITLK